MTLPPLSSIPSSLSPTATPLTPVIAPPSLPIVFPLTWLLDHAVAPIQYRAIAEVAKLDPTTLDRANPSLAALPFTHRPAIALAIARQPDGTWNRSMLTVPPARTEHFEGIGTITAVRRLLEYGWGKDSPPLVQARRVLFRLLAEDDDIEYLFEFANERPIDDDIAHRARGILREAAAATLAQAGYEDDPRLRGAARRIVTRIATYLRSPLARKPFVRAGNQHVLAPEAAPPSTHALMMLAHMPLFRTEHHDAMELLYQHLVQPLPRSEPFQLCGKVVMPQPHLVLGDRLPGRNAADDDVVAAVAWLELMARLGFLKRNDAWCALYERFLEDCDEQGVWRPRRGATVVRAADPFIWPMYPLDDHAAADKQSTDITFRLGLIGRLLGRTIEVT